MTQIFLTDKLNNLAPEFLGVIESVASFSSKLNTNAYIIGGVVRDLILNKPIYDIDIVIEGVALDFVKQMEIEGICEIVRENPDFGTLKAKFPNDIEIDFASTRTEQYPRKGHLPVVDKIGCSLQEDVLRRDFTVNALALSLNMKNFGEVIDLTGGLKDIEKCELKVLHVGSFIDDPTRIIRGLRFTHKLGFILEENTQKLQNEYIEHFNNNDICYERIKQVIKLAFNLNIGKLFDEFLSNNFYKLTTNNPTHVQGEIIENYINKYSYLITKENIWLIYAVFVFNTNNIEKFNLTGSEFEIFKSFKLLCDSTSTPHTNYEIYEQYKNVPIESLVAYMAYSGNLNAEKYIQKLKNIKLDISGKDLLNLGFAPQKKFGMCLNEVFKQKINGEINTKDEELDCARSFLIKHNALFVEQ